MGESTSTYGKSKLLPLDLLRGVAAMVVAVGHFGWLGAIDLGPSYALCVPFFFMLSGYVLAHAYGDEIASGKLDLWRFSVLRFARLYPLHFLTFLSVLAFWACIAIVRASGLFPISPDVRLHATALQWVETLTMTQMLFGNGVSFNTPSWSVSVEFWCSFYVFLLCAPVRPAIKAAAAIASTVLFTIVQMRGGLLSSDRAIAGIDKTYWIGLGCFTIGWTLHRWHKPIARVTSAVPKWIWWGTGYVTFAVVIISPIPAEFDSVYYFAFALTIAGLSNEQSERPGFNTFMAKCGDWSYGIYLWHMPLTMTLLAAVRAIEFKASVSLVGTMILDIIYILLLLVISALSFRYVEVPAKNWLRSKLTPDILVRRRKVEA